MSFAAASAVTAESAGRYKADIEPGWDIVGNANGGYLMAIAARAAAMAAGGRLPATATAHFVAPGRPGPASIDVQVHKAGRRFTTVGATLADDERPLLAFLGSFADAALPASSVTRIEAAPPDIPPPEECVPIEPTESFPPPFMGKVELRLHPEDASFTSGVPRFRGWFRLRNGEPIDSFGLLVAVDAFPPTVFAAQLPIAWTPTLELTAHIRAVPEPGWLRCLFTTRFISGGYLEEDGEVWDASGRLVAQSRQLALLPTTA
ncbi:MAG: thioesterase family protein [Acidimicrobiia bacterium]|nr:thioesterase family protein [Acidimicrobiia bacterium]